jgi:methyl-accepting chemotaxis protein
MLSGFCNWRVLAAAAGLILAHHFVFNELDSAAIFPEGSDLIRVGIHGAIIVVETVMLAFIGQIIAGAFARTDTERRAAQTALSEVASPERYPQNGDARGRRTL